MSGQAASAGKGRTKLERRVMAAAEAVLGRQQSVTPVDVLQELGWLAPATVDRWRRGRIGHLEQVTAVDPDRLATVRDILGRWAESTGLRPTEIAYVAGTPDRRTLRFTADGDPAVERAYRVHWTAPQLDAAARDKLVTKRGTAPDLVVVIPLSDWVCAECDGTGGMLVMQDDHPLCLTCVDLDHLVFVPAGDAALTRRSRKASALSAIVIRFSRSRRRYERQGILVEQAALETAEVSCLGDAEARQRRRERDRERRAAQDVTLAGRMAEEIIRLFPGCPPPRAQVIAAHASVRGSGRVGRSAAGRALADEAIVKAVIASVRHEETEYDQLLMSGVARPEARQRVRADIDRVLDSWRRG